ncbi:MAG TPA: phosphodiesterase, partial [Thermoleophilia bacterium]|nr:phosphodiesterase [Thermoleophilia bacterium]
AEFEGAHLADVAPTLLYRMGQPVPSYMDGRVLTTAFAPEYLAENPVKSSTVSVEAGKGGDAGYSSEEEALVMERLRGLGYV